MVTTPIAFRIAVTELKQALLLVSFCSYSSVAIHLEPGNFLHVQEFDKKKRKREKIQLQTQSQIKEILPCVYILF